MRLGVMIGAERGDMARKVSKLLDDIEWAESAGLDTAWMPQVPNDFDCLTMVSLMGARTSRIELGTAVVPLQAQHPIALARQALSVHAGIGGRLALGLGPSHHWIVRDMLGLPYERPAAYTRDYLEVLEAALAGPGPVDVENETFTVHNPLELGLIAPMPVLIAALGPVMLAIAGERADRILGEAEISPNYQRLLDYGDARSIGDLCAAGDETAILARFRRFADAGVTDLSVRLLPIGEGREELIASKQRTREMLAGIAADFR